MYWCGSPASRWPTPRARSAGCRTSSSAADDVWSDHRAWTRSQELIPEPPSTYYYRQVYGCFFKDRHGLESLDRVGVDNITFETDYPHTDSTWPDTKRVAEEMMAGLTDEQIYKIVRGNAIRMLDLDLDR